MSDTSRYVTGDLLHLFKTGVFNLIVHGCNCFCSMDEGIAKQIKAEFPAAYRADCSTAVGDREKLGTVSSVEVHRGIVVNAYTQFHYCGNEPLFDYDAFRSCLKIIKEQFPGRRIGLPKIGAGLAGGDWQRIFSIIEDELKGEQWKVVLYRRS